MPLFRAEVTMHCTAYIQADSKGQAKRLAHQLTGEPEISGLPFNDPNLPKISLSPAMTLKSVDNIEKLDEE